MVSDQKFPPAHNNRHNSSRKYIADSLANFTETGKESDGSSVVPATLSGFP